MDPLSISNDEKSIRHIPIIHTFENTGHPLYGKPKQPLPCRHSTLVSDNGKELCIGCGTSWEPRPLWSDRGDGYPLVSGPSLLEQMLEQKNEVPAPITMQDIIDVQEQFVWDRMLAPDPLSWGILGRRLLKLMIILTMFGITGLLMIAG